jgi:hypothetical protein
MKTINRRENPRMEIRLRCHVTVPDSWLRESMHIENISRSGVLIAWKSGEALNQIPRLGQLLTVEVELPSNHGFGQKCIHCQGTVVRVSADGGECSRVAVSLNYMDFRSLTDRPGALRMFQPAMTSWTS